MSDYGASGHNLVTPGFMIEYTAAEKIKESIGSGVEVVMRASLTIANSDNEIKISLLYSSSLDLDAESMKSFT